jgi:L-ribulose-5-phosphate 3-epimerase
LRIGYITNGFRDHDLEDVFAVLAELGYEGVGIALDHGHLHPLKASREEVGRVRESLRKRGLRAAVETGGRFVLDPWKKHWPTLISASAEGRRRRMDFLLRSLEIARALDAEVLSLWSGIRDPEAGLDESWEFLVEGLRVLEREARARGIVLGFEPEPGMLVGDLENYRELRERLRPIEAPALKLTLDLGHLHVTEEPPLDRWIREFSGEIANVHIDDARGRVHEHLMPGEGEIDLPALIRALEGIGYQGLGLVELSRHSHVAPEAARKAMEYVRKAVGLRPEA